MENASESQDQGNVMNQEGSSPGAAPQSVVSTKEWLITLVLTAIPIVGIVLLFVWAFGSGTNVNKANWAKAALILSAIFLVLYIIFAAVIMGSFMAVGDSY